MKSLTLRSRIAHFRDCASQSANQCFEYFADGVLQVTGGCITHLGDAGEMAKQGFDLAACEHLPQHLILAGFIDAHVHAPQLDVIGSYGEQLLDWLNKYTFPAEIRFADCDYSRAQTQRFINSLLANGTTSALVFTTRFKHSTEQLFELAHNINMRLIAGNVLMDRNAPLGLLGDPIQAKRDCDDLIKAWHGKGRIGYALTPRFAGTSSRQQLALAGEVLREYPDIWLQTHLSENQNEIAWTQQLFPEAVDYLDTYERYGLHHNKTVFAHCLHLSASETRRIAAHESAIAFCPSSNLFLGSGLFDLEAMKRHQIPVALATDVGAGTSLSQFKTMGDAYKVCQLQGYPLHPREAFYLSSLGAARALGIDNQVGNLAPGKEADFIVLNPANQPFIQERLRNCTDIDDELFVYMTTGDERLVDRTYIAGVLHSTQQIFATYNNTV